MRWNSARNRRGLGAPRVPRAAPGSADQRIHARIRPRGGDWRICAFPNISTTSPGLAPLDRPLDRLCQLGSGGVSVRYAAARRPAVGAGQITPCSSITRCGCQTGRRQSCGRASIIGGLVGAAVVVLGQQPPTAPALTTLTIADAQQMPARNWVAADAIGNIKGGYQFAVNRLTGKLRVCAYDPVGRGLTCQNEP